MNAQFINNLICKLHLLFLLFLPLQVFKEQDTSATDHKSKQVAESILRYFSGFDAFTLPSPTVDPETMKSINKKKEKVNPLFLSGLEKFKRLMETTLSPKYSFNDGEFVTGEGKIDFFSLLSPYFSKESKYLFILVAFFSFLKRNLVDIKKYFPPCRDTFEFIFIYFVVINFY